ncbi:MAG: FADH(2)-oxidizing methylenetetrahydrofolate--tRNA-(uracil(54)-C(5))-methyltransferase TrmFO, partial [Syntrophomonas sp.]
ASLVTAKLESEPNITLIRQEITKLPEDEVTIIATGPLTSENLCCDIQRITGEENLYFFDAVAPTVTAESLDKTRVFKASRYGKGTDDYYNCPMTREQYEVFYENLINADIKEGHLIDKKLFFSGCMPVEVIARGGKDSLRFGPMRPVGLEIPESGQRAYAVVQLRQEDREGRIYGLVGCQTRLTWGEQDRVFRLIPGLENAEFVRYGVMHRNTFINSPQLLLPTLQSKDNAKIFWAGQVTGVEGYMESAATGIFAAINAARYVQKRELLILNPCTMLGALVNFITLSATGDFQPVNANFGIIPPLDKEIKDKRKRYQAYVDRATNEMTRFSILNNL